MQSQVGTIKKVVCISEIKISYSRYSSYLNCPYQHYLRYVEGLRLKRPIRPLYFGSDFHKLLELRDRPEELKRAKQDIKDKYYEIPASWQSDLGENYLENLEEIFHDYQRVYKGIKPPKITERPFEICIGRINGKKVKFIGIIDELYKIRQGSKKIIKIGEHKTFSRAPNMNTLIMNTQKCLYAKATQLKTGLLPQTVIWDYIKSTPAKSPIWLAKSNRLSEANSKDITPYSWVRACKEHGITDKEVIRIGRKYKPNLSNFFFRLELDIVPTMVEDVWNSFMYTCDSIARNGETNKTKNMTRNCEFCNFKDICYTECTGGNREYLINKNYDVSNHRG